MAGGKRASCEMSFSGFSSFFKTKMVEGRHKCSCSMAGIHFFERSSPCLPSSELQRTAVETPPLLPEEKMEDLKSIFKCSGVCFFLPLIRLNCSLFFCFFLG